MKYMGGKASIAADLVDAMLALSPGRKVFVDAFCGGANVVCRVPSEYLRIANDSNNYLIAMWRGVVGGTEFPERIDKDFYSAQRDLFNKEGFSRSVGDKEALVGWTGFMGSFNGRFFDGGYSSHSRNGRDYIREAIANVRAQAPSLTGVDFRCGDYCELDVPDRSVIYCDIPYKNTKQYLTSRNFDYGKFYEWCVSMTNKGHRVFVSEYEMPEPFRCVWEREAKRALNPGKSKAVTERLFLCGS